MTARECVNENGFAIIRDVLPGQDIRRVLSDFENATLRRNRAGGGHAWDSARFARFSRNSQLLAIAGETLGEAAFAFRVTLFDKSSAANWLVVWRQGTALPIQQRNETPGWGPWSVKERVIYAHACAGALSPVLALRVHLDDSRADRGPLRVLPATNNCGVLDDETCTCWPPG
jgi:hypothetical protein